MALVYATRDGIVGARQERPPYFWTIFSRPGERWERLREGGKAVSRVIALGVLMDVVYQLLTFHRVYAPQLIVIVLALAFVPYVILRGPINRIARAWMTRKVGPWGRRGGDGYGDARGGSCSRTCSPARGEHDLDCGRNVSHGFRSSLRGGGARAQGQGRWLLDRRLRRDQCGVRPLRGPHRVSHDRRTPSEPPRP